jgi:phage tail sheath protein FI
MPEYLSPGVYIEETSYRSKTIEGVSTSTAGFVGPARFGPVSGQPELVTSLADFQRIFGDLEDLAFTDQDNATVNYLAHGVRTFFEEGGRRLFVQRVFNAPDGFDIEDGIPANHYANGNTPDGGTAATGFNIVARFPGAAGNMRITFTLIVGRNIFRPGNNGENHILTRMGNNSLVHVRTVDTTTDPDTIAAQGAANGLMVARRNPANGAWELYDNDPDATGATVTQDLSSAATPPDGLEVRPLTVLVEVARPTAQPNEFDEPETLGEFSFIPTARTALLSTFTPNPDNRFAALTTPFALVDIDAEDRNAITLAGNLLGSDLLDSLSEEEEVHTITYTLAGGDDGELPIPITYAGDTDFDDLTGDVLQMPLNGLLAFESVEDISIVAAPGYSASPEEDDVLGIQNALINHCERMRYRVAVLDTPPNQTTTEALAFRNLRSSDYAALYYPWVTVSDPRPAQGGARLSLPPSGFVAGIYARNDIEHAVFKAPANEVVRLAIDFEVLVNQAQQDLLNPNGVNCLRFFEGRGYLVWGARTISDDPEWKYISLRRYFAYMERSIDRSTQWAVFENNGPELWGKIRRAVEDFLYNEWVAGGLLGAKPEQAYFVRCDRSTMTQNDLDNGRLVCLIGVAPVRPAEFVIFRIGQWTADADR